jgi:Tfp pilus assembly protein PilZ
MAKAHEYLLFVFDTLDKGWDILYVADLLEHAEYCLVGSTVAWPVESGNSAGKGGVDIRLGASHVADSCGRAVELVFCVQDK